MANHTRTALASALLLLMVPSPPPLQRLLARFINGADSTFTLDAPVFPGGSDDDAQCGVWT